MGLAFQVHGGMFQIVGLIIIYVWPGQPRDSMENDCHWKGSWLYSDSKTTRHTMSYGATQAGSRVDQAEATMGKRAGAFIVVSMGKKII